MEQAGILPMHDVNHIGKARGLNSSIWENTVGSFKYNQVAFFRTRMIRYDDPAT